jgi:hypothetical protein
MKKRLRRKGVCCLLVSLFICFVGYSQSLVTIQGNIKDERSSPVSYASVYLLNSHFFAVSDTSGNFMIKNIPEGNYTLVVSAVGYATINETIQITKQGKTLFDLQLTDASRQLDEVIVTAEKKRRKCTSHPFKYFGIERKGYKRLQVMEQ